jgi:hypothetical protein
MISFDATKNRLMTFNLEDELAFALKNPRYQRELRHSEPLHLISGHLDQALTVRIINSLDHRDRDAGMRKTQEKKFQDNRTNILELIILTLFQGKDKQVPSVEVLISMPKGNVLKFVLVRHKRV